ncbi:HWE histidine kinase domain-containing protein [Sphingomonas phyllosphaerae]|uniref:HWE histidine kinase domain-containing protein n=1 Tax=Sphingomonas phyllosphaerae TaxID=257003 RepID=UPI0024135105|nr:HWE histidine kinase domain-containing protein [Sphingomonas phyllosphaerae]
MLASILDDPSRASPPLLPREPDAAVRAAVAAFAARLAQGDPWVAAFDESITPMAISDPTLPDNPLLYVNRAFEALTGFTAAELVGRNCRFMQGPLTDPAEVTRLRGAIARCERIEVDLLNHRRDGAPFWNRLTVAPVHDAGGALRYFVSSQLDVTLERHRLTRLQQDREQLAAEVAERDAALAEREERLQLALRAGGLGTFSVDPTTGAITSSASCKANFGRVSDEDVTLDELIAAVHPIDRDRVVAALASTLERGAAYDIEYRVLTPAGEQRWIAVHAEMQYRADGTPLAMVGFTTNISDRKFAEEHRAMLARELTHRVKNILATVGAVVSQTLRDAPSLPAARGAVAGRIASLGAAHELLVHDEVEGAAIGDIVERVLAPFADRDGRRFDAGGPPIRLSPEITLALSMALHELATNAIKYGALSVPEGRVTIRWALATDDGARRLRFSWIEQGGPAVTAPTRTGFGSRMIERVLAPHVSGRVAVAYPPEGARFEVEAPV